jgi:hypothetical protein
MANIIKRDHSVRAQDLVQIPEVQQRVIERVPPSMNAKSIERPPCHKRGKDSLASAFVKLDHIASPAEIVEADAAKRGLALIYGAIPM